MSEAVKDAYTKLKAMIIARFKGRPSAEVALAQYDQKPDFWKGALEAELVEVGAARDEAIVRAAQQVMAVADPAGSQSGKYAVDARGAQGVQIGDRNTQANNFGVPPTTR